MFEQKLFEIQKQMERHEEMLDKLEVAFFGDDGTTGIVSRVAKMELMLTIGVWLVGTIGGSTLITLIGIFLEGRKGV